MSCILTSSNALNSLTTPIEIGADEAGNYDSLFSLRHRAVAFFENLVSQFYFTSWTNYNTSRANTEYVIYKLDQPSEIRTLGIYKVCANEIRMHKIMELTRLSFKIEGKPNENKKEEPE